ncbi:MAG: DUF1285 domain-containing protein [Pseudomonadota bacterium]
MTNTRIARLDALIAAATAEGVAPVETWDPPYCGDIGLSIARDGTWTYGGTAINRPQLVKLFARVLRRDPNGRHFLVTPAEKVDVIVEDAPFLAVEMQVDGAGDDQVLTFRTNVDDIVVCGPDHPMTFRLEPGTGGLKPYLLVRGRLEALVTRSVYLDLVALARPVDGVARLDGFRFACRDGELDEALGGQYLDVVSGGAVFPMVPFDPSS